ncbi:hypothetical protein D9758_002969 [Tetrapyrgos nigripes]|uniref:Peptidase A1 domain-containing protein n=1 Tax=Tetrapyrgos nigripes TaxID=182062 RepID=A0A8H5GPX3_9AGAR|nr:hypothetical protein D9758_002969 [Tetrapyrgos nigripes]
MRTRALLASFLVSFLPFFSLSHSTGLSSRSSSPIIETVSLPLTIDNQRHYAVNLTVASGSQNQSLLYVLSTSTGYTSVAGDRCTNCVPGVPKYSSSDITLSNESALSLVSEESWASGPFLTGNCSIQERNGSLWTWSDQRVILADNTSGIYSGEVSGLLGLGTNARNGDYSATPMAAWLKTTPSAANFSFGLALNPFVDGSADGGTLHWVKPDEDMFQGDVAFKELLPSNSSTSDFDSFVLMDSWSFTSPSGLQVSKSSETENLVTIVDPFFSSIYFPQNETRCGRGSLPCDTRMSLTLTFGNASVTFNEDQLVLQEVGGKCIGALQEWANPSVTEYLLGSLYIANIYLIYQGSSSSSWFGFAHRKPTTGQKKISPIVIAGVVLGSAAFLLMICVIIFLCIRYRRKKADSDRSSAIINPLLDYSVTSFRAEPFIISPESTPIVLSPTSASYLLTSPTAPYNGNPSPARQGKAAINSQTSFSMPTINQSQSTLPKRSQSHGLSARRSAPTILIPFASRDHYLPHADPNPQYLLVPSHPERRDDDRLSPGWSTRGVSSSSLHGRSSDSLPSYSSRVD